MESATILTRPSTSLSGILLSVRTQHYIYAQGEVLQLHTESTLFIKFASLEIYPLFNA